MTEAVQEFIQEYISDLFYGPFFSMARSIWDWCIGLCTGIITNSPQTFSSETWEYVRETLYPWALGIGVACVNLFFLIGFCKAFMNLRENITLELCVEAMIRLVAVNVLLQVGLSFIETFFTMASLLAGQVLTFEPLSFYTADIDFGAHLFWWLFGFGYFLVALVSALMIFLTLYGRYIKLYLLVVFYPIAVPTVIAGRGVEGSAYAWVKTFLSSVFEIVVIALVMVIAGKLINGIDLPSEGIEGWFDGFPQALHSLIYMVLMASSVKGTSSFLNKAFGL